MLPKRKQHFPVLAALLLVLCASKSLALYDHVCIHDWIAAATGKVPIVATTSKTTAETLSDTAADTNDEFKPIRIKVFFTNASCTDYGPQPRAKSRAINRYYHASCERAYSFTEEKRAILLDKIIPGAVKLHQDRLLVKPASRIHVPNFTAGLCAEFAVPAEHTSSGVEDADMVLYLSALPTFGARFMWAFTCATLDGRPAVGVMNVGPEVLIDTPQSVRVAAHAMAHALGFTNDNMVEKKMVAEKTNVRKKPSVRIVTGENTVNATRKHYNCDTAEGMELEDEKITRLIPSHWERRNAKDELMAAITTAGYYSALTMAAFVDMGYYRANWSMAETMPWGHQSGCDLLEKPCVDEGQTNYPDMFCTTPARRDCTSDRLAIGRCEIFRDHEPFPEPYQYFETAYKSGNPRHLMDYCPIVTQLDTTGCTDGIAATIPGSVVGPDARCLRGQKLSFGGAPVNAVCANVSCKDNKVHVRLLGETEWRECPKGQTLEPVATKSEGFSGSVVCPAYEEVCPAMTATPQHNEGCKMDTTVPMIPKDVVTKHSCLGKKCSHSPAASFGPTSPIAAPRSGASHTDVDQSNAAENPAQNHSSEEKKTIDVDQNNAAENPAQNHSSEEKKTIDVDQSNAAVNAAQNHSSEEKKTIDVGQSNAAENPAQNHTSEEKKTIDVGQNNAAENPTQNHTSEEKKTDVQYGVLTVQKKHVAGVSENPRSFLNSLWSRYAAFSSTYFPLFVVSSAVLMCVWAA